MKMHRRRAQAMAAVCVTAVLGGASSAPAQDAPAPEPDHPQMQMDTAMNMGSSWHFMQDGVLFAEFNHQGGPRGGDEFVAPNWWMGMASHGSLTFTAMFSLDPATVGEEGYRELFQAGEAINGRPNIDHQHPHDFFMQLAAAWRVPLASSTSLTLSGGPVGEPALGPIAFMHRASALDNPTAPLTHHTFDSTHIAYGVVSAAVDHGPWTIEGSIFNGREPDDNRWDLDFGKLDSISGRLWFKPAAEWEFQVSTGHLASPEELEPGDIQRSTASASWTRSAGGDVDAVTAGFGRNDASHGNHNAAFVEGARHAGLNTVYGRFEAREMEAADGVVTAFTAGAVRDIKPLSRLWGLEGGLGADVTFYGVPDALRPAYSDHPVSVHVFFRLRAPAGAMGRIWNMRMSQPMGGMVHH